MNHSKIAASGALAGALIVSGCHRKIETPVPPRVETAAHFPERSSTLVVPISARLAELEKGLNGEVPIALWRIDKPNQTCVPPKRLKIFGKQLKVTPTLHCRIVGQVRRGRIRLSGHGDQLEIIMPVQAVVSAEDVGGIIKKETATGAAVVRAYAKLSIDGRWQPTAKVNIAYDWTSPPGIDFLGQRIQFVDKADDKLKPVIAGLEKSLPRELTKMNLRARLAIFWSRGFTSVMLNRERPPVWMRITPQRLGFGGYRVSGGDLQLKLSAEALTETFVGDRPADPKPTPLPGPATRVGAEGLRFFIPVLADFAQLEPVVERALGKLARKGIVLKGIGPVDAEFGKVTIYATEGGRLAVGVKAKAKARNAGFATTQGEVWLTAIPYNDPGSQVVRIRDLRMTRNLDSQTVNLLISLFGDETVNASIQAALVHDFAPDYLKVLTAARKAIATRREGDFLLHADVDKVTNGAIQVTGQGLFLPVTADGQARIFYRPGR
ncbi:MAG: hypothetical protein JWP15_2074 [Alphaproteobacteria bacterium]|nr:hypothetical protein [Alphaproteobacteria bacterium]